MLRIGGQVGYETATGVREAAVQIFVLTIRRPGFGGAKGRCALPARGFTLTEVLIAVVAACVVAALAIPPLVSYRQRAFDAQAVQTLGSAVAAEESHYAKNKEYVPVPPTTGTSEEKVIPPGFKLPDGVTIRIDVQGDKFTCVVSSQKGSGKVYTFDSVSGALIAN